MSEYKGFTTEFPSRCLELLYSLKPAALEQDRECTLLLALTSAAICGVADRIGATAPKGRASATPTVSGREVNRNRRRHGEFLEKRASALFQFADPPSWCPRQLPSKGRNTPDTWDWRALPSDWTVERLMNLLRNAFAHGNIWSLSHRSSPVLREFVFAQRLDEPHPSAEPAVEAIRILPSSLHMVMVEWSTSIGAPRDGRARDILHTEDDKAA